ncbi:MAG: AraC family transcriptional regulator [Polaromonas sp.]|nr:AraC family transcriptional regulator [Polaromonas sp.]
MTPTSHPISISQGHDTLSLRHYGASHGSHAHDHFQMLLGLEGTLELEVNGRGRHLHAGQGCVIAPGDHHDFESRHGSRCLVLDTADAGWAPCTAQPERAQQAMVLAHYLAHTMQQSGTLALLQAPALLLEAWRPGHADAVRPKRTIDWPALAQWARQRLHEDLTVADLAAQSFLSTAQFTARCRHETGQSPMQWLRGLRLQQARTLRAAGLSVAATAWRCGYQSPSALTAALRRAGQHASAVGH